MPTRRIDDQFERDSFIASLPLDGKYLYKYCIVNPQQRQCGIWEAPLNIISSDCDIPIERIKELLHLFEEKGKIRYFPEFNKVWTKNFLIWQGANTDFVKVAIQQVKRDFKDNPRFIEEYRAYYNDWNLWKEYDIDFNGIEALATKKEKRHRQNIASGTPQRLARTSGKVDDEKEEE